MSTPAVAYFRHFRRTEDFAVISTFRIPECPAGIQLVYTVRRQPRKAGPSEESDVASIMALYIGNTTVSHQPNMPALNALYPMRRRRWRSPLNGFTDLLFFLSWRLPVSFFFFLWPPDRQVPARFGAGDPIAQRLVQKAIHVEWQPLSSQFHAGLPD